MAAKFTGLEWAHLADHVAPHEPKPGDWVSTFNAAVREARYLSNRDPSSGQRQGPEPIALWAATLVYLVLLEQIGKSLRPKWGKRASRESEVEKAIRQFAPQQATKRQRQVIYALRCAFAHEFGLFNSKSRPEYRCVFRLDDDPSGSLVEWPSRRWDGTLADAGDKTSTTINLIALADVAEAVVKSVRVHSNQAKLRAEVPVEELRKRFSFRIDTE